MAKMPSIRIPRVSMASALVTIRGQAPPTYDLDHALRQYGPAVMQHLNEGWGDEDLIASLLEADKTRRAEIFSSDQSTEEAPLSLTRDSLVAVLHELDKRKKKARRERRLRDRARKAIRQQTNAPIETRSPALDPRSAAPALPSKAGAPLLSDQRSPEGKGGTPLSLPAPDVTPDRNPGID